VRRSTAPARHVTESEKNDAQVRAALTFLMSNTTSVGRLQMSTAGPCRARRSGARSAPVLGSCVHRCGHRGPRAVPNPSRSMPVTSAVAVAASATPNRLEPVRPTVNGWLTVPSASPSGDQIALHHLVIPCRPRTSPFIDARVSDSGTQLTPSPTPPRPSTPPRHTPSTPGPNGVGRYHAGGTRLSFRESVTPRHAAPAVVRFRGARATPIHCHSCGKPFNAAFAECPFSHPRAQVVVRPATAHLRALRPAVQSRLQGCPFCHLPVGAPSKPPAAPRPFPLLQDRQRSTASTRAWRTIRSALPPVSAGEVDLPSLYGLDAYMTHLRPRRAWLRR